MNTLRTHDGLDLFVRDFPVEAPKALVVLTHGIGEHCDRYEHVCAAFNAAGYSFFAYDLRGHGRSHGRRAHTPSLEHLLDDLAAVAERARASAPGKKLFVYGHSMGGNITLNFALRRSQGVSGVIATSPWLILPKPPPGLVRAAAKVLSRIAPEFTFQRPRDPSGLSHDPAIVAAAMNDPLGSDVITARQFVELSTGATYALANAQSLNMPLYIAHGEVDSYTSPEGSKRFYAAVRHPDKTIKLYPGMYHELHNELEPTRSEHLGALTTWLDVRC